MPPCPPKDQLGHLVLRHSDNVMAATLVYSHSAGPSRQCKPLREHLVEVASRARCYAEAFGAGPQAELAGLTHDIGKYGPLFQRRLEGKEHGLDHWTAGACACLCLPTNFRLQAVASAAAVLGHHIGLQRVDEESIRALTRKDILAANPSTLRFPMRARMLTICFPPGTPMD